MSFRSPVPTTYLLLITPGTSDSGSETERDKEGPSVLTVPLPQGLANVLVRGLGAVNVVHLLLTAHPSTE